MQPGLCVDQETDVGLTVMLIFPLLRLVEQNESKHDGSPSPGMTDQEKEVAASAYEAFVVIQHFFKHRDTSFRVHLCTVGRGVFEHVRMPASRVTYAKHGH